MAVQSKSVIFSATSLVADRGWTAHWRASPRSELFVAIAPTIDTHAHYFPESYLRLIAEHGKRCGTTVVTEGGKTFIQVGLLLRTGPITSDFHDLDDRIKTMDR